GHIIPDVDGDAGAPEQIELVLDRRSLVADGRRQEFPGVLALDHPAGAVQRRHRRANLGASLADLQIGRSAMVYDKFRTFVFHPDAGNALDLAGELPLGGLEQSLCFRIQGRPAAALPSMQAQITDTGNSSPLSYIGEPAATDQPDMNARVVGQALDGA